MRRYKRTGTGCGARGGLALAGAMLIAAAPAPEVPPLPVPPAAEQLDFTPDPARLTLPVHIGAGGPYRFVVDTGSERTIVSAAIAEALALPADRPVRIATVAGSVTVPTARIAHLRMSPTRSMTDVVAPVLSAAHIGADGMLGIDALKGRTVLFDFREHAMTIGAPPIRDAAEAGDIVVAARTLRGRMIFGDGRVEHTRTAVILDTGAEVTIGNAALRRALAARRRLPPTYPGAILTITGMVMPVDMIRVNALDLGGVALQGMPVAFASAPIFAQLGLEERPALLLGMDALRLFDRVAVDFRTRRVRFRI